MTVYSVYEPPVADETDVATRADKIAFVKDGFSWVALVVPALWLIYQRMWIELIVFLFVITAVQWGFGTSTEGAAAGGWVTLALTVLFAFEANDLRGWALERRGYRFAAIASGRDRYEAERSFFDGWLPKQARPPHAVQPMQKAGRGDNAPPPVQASDSDDVIGLFPRA
ncbi:MAG: DUF2628 domain-containing protein [Methyloceanibacter sp.]